MAKLYGGGVDEIKQSEGTNGAVSGDSVETETGWRYSKEVVAFLRKRGAKIGELHHSIEGDWAAYRTDGEMSPADQDDSEESVFFSGK